MKILDRPLPPATIERSFAELPATVPTASLPPALSGGAVSGSDGASPFYGDLALAETNPDLIGPQRFRTFNIMRSEDSVVRSCLWMFKLVMRSADITLKPASADPLDAAVCDATAWQFGLEGELGKLDLSWDEQLQQSLLLLDFGSMFEEIVVGDVETWRDADGDEHLLRTFSRLAPRFPGTVRYPDGIATDPRSGAIRSLTQWIPNTSPIPGDRLVYYALDREGQDWLGRSLLRSMYGPWRFKRAVMISAGMGWDRHAFGTPVVRYPKGGGATKKREAEAIGRNWRTHERGYVVLEGTLAEGWDVAIEGGATTLADPTPILGVYNDEMRQAALQHFAGLGRVQSGSRALGDVQVEPFYLACQAIADGVALQKMRLAFRRFVDLNFGTDVDVPRLTFANMGAENVLNIAQAISYLSDAGLDFTDRDTQNDLRDTMRLRHLPEETQAVIDNLPPGVGVKETATTPPTPLPFDASNTVRAAAEGTDLGL